MAQDIEITIQDNGAGAVVVPQASVQVVIACCSSGTPAQVVATRSPATLQSTFGYGFLPEYGALGIQAGGTILAMRAATNTAGAITALSAVNISGATNASPIVITTATPHAFATGYVVTIASVGGNTAANGTFVITVLSSTTLSLTGSTGNSAYTSGGTATFTGTVQSGSGTSVMTFTGTPYDDYFPLVTITTGGTVGTNGIIFTVSLDAGRLTGPSIPLGTATTYTIAQTGLTINFENAKTLVAGDTARCSTMGPQFAVAGVQACLSALQATGYALSGWGSIHVAAGRAGVSAADCATMQGYLDSLVTGGIYTGIMTTARDAYAPTAWGGAGETENAWITSVLTDYSAASAKRMLSSGGFYNMPSAYPTPAASAPRYRRPLAWAQAARQVAIPPQRHSGRVRDGALSQIVVSPTTDPTDGFIYHDERVTPAFDVYRNGSGRLCCATTWDGQQGFFIYDPLMLSPIGSDFYMWPFRAVMDVACKLVRQSAITLINSDIRLNQNGTIYVNEALSIEAQINQVLKDNMTAVNMISGASVSVDRTNNVRTTSTVIITVTINARGYIRRETIAIGFANTNASE